MNIFEIENFLRNFSFFLLFVSMISYWIQVAFVIKVFNIGRLSMISANFCLLSLLILRWKESGHFPLSNLYESLMFLSWSLSTFHLILENIELGENELLKLQDFFNESLNIKPFGRLFSVPPGQKKSFCYAENNKKLLVSQQSWQPLQKKTKKPFLGVFTAPAALFTNAFATFSLPNEMQHSSALVPALQSNWLMMHVTVMILSYSALICGSLLSIAFLILTKDIHIDLNTDGLSNSLTLVSQSPIITPASSLEEPVSVWPNSFKKPMKKKFAENLDNLSYRILGIGFPLLTIGILSGAVWANEAWGSYWSWDPKETWALATWLVFAIYLHTRLTKGWRGKKPALIASLGFFIVWICFLGVNLLGEGLHSYGFFK
eukprot:GHRR01000105.1.p1 GENE.GHRR01000105.1~~GHRR01000105.1.p1  ORF type:complete len:375 (+),score=-58.30 GHRR01000105.1:1010-2134(+)